MTVSVIGAGLAGCECAWQLARRGIAVDLYEMKPQRHSPAHTSDSFAELVCSNSLRANGLANAVGLLKQELRVMDSLILACADANQVPAGGALAVDRVAYAAMVTEKIEHCPGIRVIHQTVTQLPEGPCVIATGPLTDGALGEVIESLCPGSLHFYDAAAPIVTFESIDMEQAYFASRYGRGSADYINCGMDEATYKAFWNELIHAEEAPVHGFEDSGVFEGCMPVEVMARRGEETLRFGPLKPVGLRDPRTLQTPYAVVQLRRDNAEGTLYNLVGFQTHLKFPEQRRVFSMIPALHDAEFVRYGVMHRNSYLNSPALLDRYYRLRSEPRIAFAGQITGVEGYVESCASGLLVGVETARRLQGKAPLDFPVETAIGALALYVSGSSVGNFQPMNINFGLMPPLETRVRGKQAKHERISARALEIVEHLHAKDNN